MSAATLWPPADCPASALAGRGVDTQEMAVFVLRCRLTVPHDKVQAELVLRTGRWDERSRRRLFERSQFRLAETLGAGIADMVEYRHELYRRKVIDMQRYAFIEGFPSQSGEDFQANTATVMRNTIVVNLLPGIISNLTA